MAVVDDRPLFVETTIPIWRQTMPTEVRRRIMQTLEHRRLISSTYVKAEYINTYLRAAVDVHNVVVDSEDLTDACGRWATHWASSTEKLGWYLLSSLSQGAVEKEDVLRRLREIIEVTLLLWFDQTVPDVKDTTHCEAAQARPRYDGAAYELRLDFPAREAPDGLRDFLDHHAALLRKVEDAIHEESKHWKQVRESLRRLLAGKYDLGLRAWQILSDIVIALEARDFESEIYTSNVRDYEPVCKAIDLPLRAEYIKPRAV